MYTYGPAFPRRNRVPQNRGIYASYRHTIVDLIGTLAAAVRSAGMA